MNWDEVEAYMHLENTLESNEVSEEKKRPVVRQTRSTSSQIELTRGRTGCDLRKNTGSGEKEPDTRNGKGKSTAGSG